MDSVTQIVLGAAVGEAVLGKKVGGRAMLWGGIAGTIPDLDVFIKFFTDHVTAAELHRGFSHSLVFCILLAPVLGFLVHKIHQKRSATRSGWSWLFFWALVTHPLLDAHTVWGTQFFWPFEYRLAYKNIFVVDPLYTLPFLFFLLLALFTRRSSPRRRLFNNAGLIISSSYMVLTLIFKWVSFNEFEDRLKIEGVEYVQMDTRPTPLNSILWNAQIETKSGFRIAYYSLLDTEEIKFSKEHPKNDYLLNPVRNQKIVQQLIKISDGWYMVEDNGDGSLGFIDLRFGQIGVDPDNSPFLWRFQLIPNPDGSVTCNRIQDHVNDVGIGVALKGLWKRMQGN